VVAHLGMLAGIFYASSQEMEEGLSIVTLARCNNGFDLELPRPTPSGHTSSSATAYELYYLHYSSVPRS
jgi:hypothetical protein